jgi:hypothetical protein
VPIQAIHRHQGRFYCFVKEGDKWRPKPVTIGASNEKFVVINDGLSEKDFVALNPVELIDQVTLPDAPPPDGELIAAAEAPVVASETPATTPAAPPTSPVGESPAPHSSFNTGDIVAQIFERGDANADGALTRDELPAQFRDRFTTVDANGNGSIDKAELAAAMARHARERAADAGPAASGE